MKVTLELNTELLNTDQLRALSILTYGAWIFGGEPKREEIRAGGTSSEDADERVRKEWMTIGEMIAEALLEADPREKPPLPIKRSEVVLKVGDRVRFRSTSVLPDEYVIGENTEKRFSTTAYPFAAEDIALTATGKQVLGDRPAWADVVTINGRPIIDGE